MRIVKGVVISILGLLSMVQPAFAHVVVTPEKVGVGKRQNFVVGVPTEKDMPTVGLRLVLPEGLQSVAPLVKPGWNIELIKTGEGEDAKVTEIIWSGGNIPAEQRDEFVFRAQVPAKEATLNWKAYQTYADGEIVAWDKDAKTVEEYEKKNPVPEGEHDDNAPLPYSQTNIINDLQSDNESKKESGNSSTAAISMSLIALLLSVAAIGMQVRGKK